MNRRATLTWVALALLALLLAACGNIQSTSNDQPAQRVDEVHPLVPAPSAETGEMVDETTRLWFVELEGAPLAELGTQSIITTQQQEFRTAALDEGLQLQERFVYQDLFNGFSVDINPADVSKLANLPGVKAIYPVVTMAIPEVEPVLSTQLMTAIEMTGADVAQNELGLTGQGVRVAIMDTGIDYNHPDLGGGWGNRVVTGWDFVGDDFTAGLTPKPDSDPMDCNGHGTHVAGIVGANGQVVGVAPNVTFGAYKVFGCEGSTTADIMIAAMERVVADGMHVLNMSIGSAFQWPQYPTAVAASRLVDRGVVVVASIGNSGTNGVYGAGAPGLGENVIGVASFDNIYSMERYFEVEGREIGYNLMTNSPEAPDEGTEEIVWIGEACNVNLPLPDLTGYAALAARGTCAFSEKAINAINAGATAVIIHNNAAGNFSGTLGDFFPEDVPVVSISGDDGLFIRASLPTNLTWREDYVAFPTPTGGLISSFSSYGLSPDLTLKPDIAGPGGFIWSTYPLAKGGYANIGGTSMAAPHVAGAAALLLEARPNTRPREVRTILQNTADPKLFWGIPDPVLGYIDNVHRQGAGMVDIVDAVTTQTRIEPSKLSLGASATTGTVTRTLTLYNNSNASVRYNLSSTNALSTSGSTFSPSFNLSNASVVFSMPSVTVPARSSATVIVTITPATAPLLGQYGGYLVFTPQGGGVTLSVPFAGFIGNYQSIQALGPGFPLLVTLEDGTYYDEPTGATYTMQGDNVPFFLVRLWHQVSALRMEVFDANGRLIERAMPDIEYLGRNSTATGFYSFSWDGSTQYARNRHLTRTMPNGTYTVKISVLKALGNERNPAHWETWTSPPITLARP